MPLRPGIALANIACPAFTTDGAGRIHGLNAPAEALLGHTSTLVHGLRCWEVFAGRDRYDNRLCVARCAVRAMLARGEVVNPFELRLKAASGVMRDVTMTAVPLRGAGCGRGSILHLLGSSARAGEMAGRDGGDQPAVGRDGAPGDGRPALNDRRHSVLSRRENETLILLAAGKSCHDIARELTISVNTVRNHLKRLFPKLRVHSQAEAVAFAFMHGLV